MNYFKKRRMELGLSQVELSRLIGCHKQQIYNIETDRALLPKKYLSKASKALKINKDDLLKFLIEEKISKYIDQTK